MRVAASMALPFSAKASQSHIHGFSRVPSSAMGDHCVMQRALALRSETSPTPALGQTLTSPSLNVLVT